jgi:hypothetical protein
MSKTTQLSIQVYAHWVGISEPMLVGVLFATPLRGKEIFSFEYDYSWLKSNQAHTLDPSLELYQGTQYADHKQDNFGVFLDSSPDRWGRMLMNRREAQQAREEDRKEHKLLESDYLLEVIVFYICISNVDDHLRNHGFILQPNGWILSPAFDINPVANGNGLKLNISESDNSQDLALAKSVAEYFRVKPDRADIIIKEVISAVKGWQQEANTLGISTREQAIMKNAFRI